VIESRVATAIAELRSQPHVSVETAGRALNVGRGLAYEMARRGELPVLRLGRRKIRVLSRPLLDKLQASD
jgi:excisionase family DNA binding protein